MKQVVLNLEGFYAEEGDLCNITNWRMEGMRPDPGIPDTEILLWVFSILIVFSCLFVLCNLSLCRSQKHIWAHLDKLRELPLKSLLCGQLC